MTSKKAWPAWRKCPRKVSNAQVGVGRGKTKKIDIDIISQRGGEQEEIGKLKVTECSDFKG
ncbi:MAG TPA: hypothetical protein VE692_05295 [Nitrososphaera sp.]|nr:hypothetical protein [Nitrososphaera sp.]